MQTSTKIVTQKNLVTFAHTDRMLKKCRLGLQLYTSSWLQNVHLSTKISYQRLNWSWNLLRRRYWSVLFIGGSCKNNLKIYTIYINDSFHD